MVSCSASRSHDARRRRSGRAADSGSTRADSSSCRSRGPSSAGQYGRGFVPTADTVVEAGDQVLLVLDSGLEDQITPVFAPKPNARHIR